MSSWVKSEVHKWVSITMASATLQFVLCTNTPEAYYNSCIFPCSFNSTFLKKMKTTTETKWWENCEALNAVVVRWQDNGPLRTRHNWRHPSTCVAATLFNEATAKLAAMDSRVFRHTHELQFKENNVTLCGASWSVIPTV